MAYINKNGNGIGYVSFKDGVNNIDISDIFTFKSPLTLEQKLINVLKKKKKNNKKKSKNNNKKKKKKKSKKIMKHKRKKSYKNKTKKQ